jgi:hypothetical protein
MCSFDQGRGPRQVAGAARMLAHPANGREFAGSNKKPDGTVTFQRGLGFACPFSGVLRSSSVCRRLHPDPLSATDEIRAGSEEVNDDGQKVFFGHRLAPWRFSVVIRKE